MTPPKSPKIPVNPFEEKLDRLHLPVFSPSVFAPANPVEDEDEEKPFWSIEQLSRINPADIDESSQQTTSELDSDSEEKAQKAINKYFNNHMVPSPWSDAKPRDIFPSTPRYIPDESATSMTPQFNNYSKTDRFRSRRSVMKVKKKDGWTQTNLTIPLDVDLLQLLGDKYKYCDTESETVDFPDALDSSTNLFPKKLFTRSSDDEFASFLPSPTQSPIKNEVDSHAELSFERCSMSPSKVCYSDDFKGTPKSCSTPNGNIHLASPNNSAMEISSIWNQDDETTNMSTSSSGAIYTSSPVRPDKKKQENIKSDFGETTSGTSGYQTGSSLFWQSEATASSIEMGSPCKTSSNAQCFVNKFERVNTDF